MFSWPKSPLYSIASLALWILFLSAIFGVTWGKYNGWPELLLWAVALVPAVTVLIQTLMAYSLISKQDEFVRALVAKRMLVAIGATITIVVAYAPFQQFMAAPDVPLWLIYPLFWAAFGILGSLVRDGGRS